MATSDDAHFENLFSNMGAEGERSETSSILDEYFQDGLARIGADREQMSNLDQQFLSAGIYGQVFSQTDESGDEYLLFNPADDFDQSNTFYGADGSLVWAGIALESVTGVHASDTVAGVQVAQDQQNGGNRVNSPFFQLRNPVA